MPRFQVEVNVEGSWCDLGVPYKTRGQAAELQQYFIDQYMENRATFSDPSALTRISELDMESAMVVVDAKHDDGSPITAKAKL